MTSVELVTDERTVEVNKVRVETIQRGLSGQSSYEGVEPIDENTGD
ncbi:hypothetical protein [Halobacillus salinus]|nr:hypothetical protein [Halobacillus salinus]